MTDQRFGIIDIGSNSIRLVIYERTEHGANQVIDSSKRSARLSKQIAPDGSLPEKAIQDLVSILNHFRLICSQQRTFHIHAVATAAIRNATNCHDILNKLQAGSGLSVQLLSGREEAEYGFLGMRNSLDISDGFLIDIGGGSTEVSLFRNRQLLQSVSFPFGCVNMTERFAEEGQLDDVQLQAMEAQVKEMLQSEPWIEEHENLPLVAVGGTARAFAKLHQAKHGYPLRITHHYPIDSAGGDELFELLRQLPLQKRKKFPGLSKDRVDLIVPGLALLRILLHATRASGFLICGSGLRDGVFYMSRFPQQPQLDNLLESSVANLLALHPRMPSSHLNYVRSSALSLYDDIKHRESAFPPRARLWLDAAAALFRIGSTIDYEKYEDHTFYMIMNAGLNGLNHHEIVMVAAIASFKTKNRTRQLLHPYKALLTDSDFTMISQLGILLQLAIALDRCQTQALQRFSVTAADDTLHIRPLLADGQLEVERLEVASLAEDFYKIWKIAPLLHAP
ncbi:Ppx/GppA family phosphatase [Paenibacillaceae bacterium]|nr:Ppx/GppA family phosphatase [Paenibacillaceae bacterium]